jgi:hypothetical protein
MQKNKHLKQLIQKELQRLELDIKSNNLKREETVELMNNLSDEFDSLTLKRAELESSLKKIK